MSKLTCPGCGSVYALEVVARYPQFVCAVCQQVIVVPLAAPPDAPAARAPAPAPIPVPAAPPPRSAPPRHARRHVERRTEASSSARRRTPSHGRDHSHAHGGRKRRSARRKSPQTALLVGAVVGCAAIVGGFFLAMSGDPDPHAETASGAASPMAPPTPKGDPKLDPAVWKASPASVRDRLRRETLDAIDRDRDSTLRWAVGFFRERNEDEARVQVCQWAIEKNPNAQWAHEELGNVDVLEKFEALAESCPRADEVRTDAILELEALRREDGSPRGKWWVAKDVATEIEKLIETVQDDERRLGSEYEYGIARWVAYQRTIEVMKDYPTVHGKAGPFLVFVQTGAGESADEAEMTRAKRVLAKHQLMLTKLYDGWMAEFGPRLGLTRYGADNLDFDTLLKVNVFSREADYRRYNERVMGPFASLWTYSAYYNPQEPRFVTSHGETASGVHREHDSALLSEAVSQLTHFYARDLSRRALEHKVSWSDARARPLWSTWGLAEFFSSHERDGDAYRWMQPSTRRLRDIWLYDQVLEKKGWAPFSLEELLSVSDWKDLQKAAAKRGPDVLMSEGATPQEILDAAFAPGAMQRVFFADSWSLVNFLWNAEQAGAPRYRNAYLDYLKDEFQIDYDGNPRSGVARPRPAGMAAFRKALGLGSDSAVRAFEREWQQYEERLSRNSTKASWLAARSALFKALGIER